MHIIILNEQREDKKGGEIMQVFSCGIIKFNKKGKTKEEKIIPASQVKKESSFRRSLNPQHKEGEILSGEALTRMMLNF